MNPDPRPGHALVSALAARDFPALRALLAPDATLHALVPGGLSEAEGAAEAAARVEGWFGDARRFDLLASHVEPVADRLLVTYRFFVDDEEDGPSVVEQHAFVDADADGRVARIDLVCSGFRAIAPAAGTRHVYDAGDLGCASGLPRAFRERLGGVAVGDELEVVTRDPSAREDIPSLARMLGHDVAHVRTLTDGRLAITVTRRR